MQDLMALRSMGEKEGMTPYEQVKLDYMSAKKPSGVAIAGLTVASVAAAAGITAWIFGGMQASAKGKEAKEAAYAAEKVANTQYNATLALMTQQNQNTKDNIDRLLLGLQRETDARVAGDINLTNTVTDSQTGSQASQLTAAQQAELAASQATQQVMMQTFSDAVTGKSSLNPTPVMIYSAPQPCNCPGCGCNG